jgi:hypothetical protein
MPFLQISDSPESIDDSGIALLERMQSTVIPRAARLIDDA